MVYTEYFAEGTVPTEVCDLHGHGFFGTLAGIFSGKPAQPDPDAAAASPLGSTAIRGTAGSTQSTAAATPAANEPPGEIAPLSPDNGKKRGFWGRVFGRGKGDKKN